MGKKQWLTMSACSWPVIFAEKNTVYKSLYYVIYCVDNI